jgi:aminoglycoside phosphotransferase (APT) family kinase protein
MASPTQRTLTPADIEALARASFGPGTRVSGCAPLSGGGFAAVWRLRLDGEQDAVIKVAPPPEVTLLRYERGLIAAEADYFELARRAAPGLPVPGVLVYGQGLRGFRGDWLFTELLPGTPLAVLRRELPETALAPVWRALGTALAELHEVTGPRFGYTGPRAHGTSWPEAFGAMLDDLLADAVDWRVDVPAERIRAIAAGHADLLSTMDIPRLLHFDLWAGNILATGPSTSGSAPSGVDGRPSGVDGGLRLSGLVDGERYLYGDPLLDLVSPALFGRIEDEPVHPLLAGYAAAAGMPLPLGPGAVRRILLYRLHLYLLMTVEMPSRGMTRDTHGGRYARLAALLAEHLDALETPI